MGWQRKIPFGYQMQGGRITCCPAEAEAVRGIFGQYLAGESYAKIAAAMTTLGVPYHRHTPQWNKHMVKRILENEDYVGARSYPRLISNEDFLAARFQRDGKQAANPRPSFIDPIREKAVCAECGGRMCRDTKGSGLARWKCQDRECGASVYMADSDVKSLVDGLLLELASSSSMSASSTQEELEPSPDLLRIENEIALGFNRGGIDPSLMKTLIFAATAERYALLPDPSSDYMVEDIRQRLESSSAEEKDLRDLLRYAVKSILIRRDGDVALELIDGSLLQGKEEPE